MITLLKPVFGPPRPLPLYASVVPAGFPSPADDYIETSLDLNDLVERPAATFFCRVSGHSMKNAGILDGDLAIVDRSRRPGPGAIVVAAIADELTLKRLECRRGGWFLAAANPDYHDIPVSDETSLEIWGVVTHVIHTVAGPPAALKKGRPR